MTPDDDPADILAAARRVAKIYAGGLGITRYLGPDGIDSAADLAAANSIRRWRAGRGGPFYGYLTVTVRRQLIDDVRSLYGRGRRRPFPLGLDDVTERSSGGADWAGSAVAQFLESLTERDRWIIEGTSAGASQVELSRLLGTSAALISLRITAIRECWRAYEAA